jgi:predicted RNase H-like HicB family nuclease
MKTLQYRVLLREEPEGGYTVIVPSLPGCVTYGETLDEAKRMAKEAIELYIQTLKELGEEIQTDEGTFECVVTLEAGV